MSLKAQILLMLVLVGCNRPQANLSSLEHQAIDVTIEVCAACGMVVAEQSLPRCQLIHRDGTRAFFCSPGDLLVYLQAPSPHGRVEQVFIEAVRLDPASGLNLQKLALESLGWQKAETLFYLKGIARPDVMGEPILAFAQKEDATVFLQLPDVQALQWSELKP